MARNHSKTIASLERLAERPGTPEEGATARRLLEKMRGNRPSPPTPNEYDFKEFPRFTRIYYNYWAYAANCPGEIVGKTATIERGIIWVRIKFDHLKHPSRVPVTSRKGCHLSLTPLEPERAMWLQRSWQRY